MPSDQIEFSFPNLAGGDRITSPETPSYNCIAWAASDTGHWWWPTALRGYYWPAEAPRSGSIRDFIAAFGKLGYEPVENAELEEGIEKIAIYADEQGDPTHMARRRISFPPVLCSMASPVLAPGSRMRSAARIGTCLPMSPFPIHGAFLRMAPIIGDLGFFLPLFKGPR